MITNKITPEEETRNADRCAYFHESIRMYCGGVRATHSARYADHEFVEGLVERLTEPPAKPVRDPFFENTEKLPPRKELEAELAKWKRRARAFQEGYRDKSFEVTSLEIQLMDLRAHGVDKVTARQNESLRTKLLSACIERNEAREALRGLLRGHKCWCSTWVGGEHEPECEAARAALSLVDAPKTKGTE